MHLQLNNSTVFCLHTLVWILLFLLLLLFESIFQFTTHNCFRDHLVTILKIQYSITSLVNFDTNFDRPQSSWFQDEMIRSRIKEHKWVTSIKFSLYVKVIQMYQHWIQMVVTASNILWEILSESLSIGASFTEPVSPNLLITRGRIKISGDRFLSCYFSSSAYELAFALVAKKHARSERCVLVMSAFQQSMNEWNGMLRWECTVKRTRLLSTFHAV